MATFMAKNFKAYPVTFRFFFDNVNRFTLGNFLEVSSCAVTMGLLGGDAGGEGCGGGGLGGGGVSSLCLRFRLNLFLGVEEVRNNKTSNCSMQLSTKYFYLIILMNYFKVNE